MKMTIKVEKLVKKLDHEVELNIPEEQTFWFQTGERRSICITPVWTKYNKEHHNKKEEIFALNVVSVYLSFENRIVEDYISLCNIESGTYEQNQRIMDIVAFLKDNNFFNKRSKETFEGDLAESLRRITENIGFEVKLT